MPEKKRRHAQTYRIDASGQLGLGLEVDEDAPVAKHTVLGNGVRFVDPSPERIRVGDCFLGELVRSTMPWLAALRELLRGLDFSAYIARYKGGGRSPFHPALMLGIILFGHLTGRTSLRQMEEMARSDIRVWWLSGATSPDYSSFCRFTLLHQNDLSAETFEHLTAQILRLLGSKANSVAIDGTVVQAAASRWKLIKEEAAREALKVAQANADAAPNDLLLQGKVQQAEVVLATVQQRNEARQAKQRVGEAKVAASEPEAVNQPLKTGGTAPAYKPSIAVNAERVITAHSLEASNEAVQVSHLVEQTERVSGEHVETVMADAGYNTNEIRTQMTTRQTELLCPEGKTTHGDKSWVQQRKHFGKDQFVYDPEEDVYYCPNARKLSLESHNKARGKSPAYDRYQSKDCSGCPLAEQCLATIKGKRSTRRTVKRYAGEALKERLREKMTDKEQRRRYKQRQATVEPVHGEQKQLQGMRRFRRRGLTRVRLEYSLHCMAHNLRRYKVLSLRASARRVSKPRRMPTCMPAFLPRGSRRLVGGRALRQHWYPQWGRVLRPECQSRTR